MFGNLYCVIYKPTWVNVSWRGEGDVEKIKGNREGMHSTNLKYVDRKSMHKILYYIPEKYVI